MINIIQKMSLMFFVITLGMITWIGVDLYGKERHDNIEIMKEISREFMLLHPTVQSIEYWRLDTGKGIWSCILGTGDFNLCKITPTYKDDLWSQRTTIQIRNKGYVMKKLDNKAEFVKYVELLGTGYKFIKMDTTPNETRVTFVSKEDNEELINDMKGYTNRWSDYINKI